MGRWLWIVLRVIAGFVIVVFVTLLVFPTMSAKNRTHTHMAVAARELRHALEAHAEVSSFDDVVAWNPYAAPARVGGWGVPMRIEIGSVHTGAEISIQSSGPNRVWGDTDDLHYSEIISAVR